MLLDRARSEVSERCALSCFWLMTATRNDIPKNRGRILIAELASTYYFHATLNSRD